MLCHANTFSSNVSALYSSRVKKLLAGIKDARARHKERHRPTGFEFALADSIHFLNPNHWDAVTASAGFFLRRSYLSLLEEHRPEEFCSRYSLIYRQGEPQAAVAAQILDVSGDRVLGHGKSKKPNLLHRALSPAARKASAVVRERVLVCGNLFSWGCHGVAFAPGANPKELWPAVVEALYRIRRAERLSGETNLVFIKELSAAQHETAQVLRRFSYRPVETEPDMVLEVMLEWRSYGDYLNSLDRKYRTSAQQIAKEIEEAGCTVERVKDLESCRARLHELYLAVHENAPVRPATLSPNYLSALAKAAGEDFSCIVIRRSGEVLGFVTLVRDGELAIGYYIGYDRLAATTLPLYLRLLHAVVQQAIEWGCQRLSLGRTALEPKARLGATPQPLFIWARHRHSAVNFFVRKLVYAIPHQEPPERNPFKSAPQP
jgi:predicted N-acyltransferase